MSRTMCLLSMLLVACGSEQELEKGPTSEADVPPGAETTPPVDPTEAPDPEPTEPAEEEPDEPEITVTEPEPTDTGTPSTTPVDPMLLVEVSGGYNHSCERLAGGEVSCSGVDTVGQIQVVVDVYDKVVAGDHLSCGIRQADAGVTCWGAPFDAFGQDQPPAGTYTDLALGIFHGCGLDGSGALTCWGADTFGQVSGAPAGTFDQVTGGYRHGCALAGVPGTATCWGDDTFGQSTPDPQLLTSVSAGALHTCALTFAGDVSCWGDDEYGQASAPAGTFVEVSSGDWHTCAIDSAGAVTCWGDDALGQSTPPQGLVAHGVDGGGSHTCAIDDSDAVVCWGWESAWLH